jgi:hypothetical protein
MRILFVPGRFNLPRDAVSVRIRRTGFAALNLLRTTLDTTLFAVSLFRFLFILRASSLCRSVSC